MIILNEFNRHDYINARLAEMLPSYCTLHISDDNTTINYNDNYVCRVFETGNYMNVYHHVLKSDVLYGDTTPHKFSNLTRYINNDLLYNSLVIDKILLETTYFINLSIEQINLINIGMNYIKKKCYI